MHSKRLAVFSGGVLGYNLLVILWGAYVRSTKSGAGCGSHWPLCNGEVLPTAPALATIIEFTHRLTSGFALILVLATLVWAFRAYPKKHWVRFGAKLSVFFMLTEALVGAGLVLFELVAENKSIARALFMSVHLINTFLLLLSLTLTAWWAAGGSGIRLRGQGRLTSMLILNLIIMLVLGVSGAIAALGDTLFPATSLAQGLSQDFSPTAHLLLRLRLLHPFIAVISVVYTIFTATLVYRSYPNQKSLYFTAVTVFIAISQLALGTLNVYLLAPIWLQLVHLFVADLMWVAVVLLGANALSQPLASASLPAGKLGFDNIGEKAPA